MKKCPYCAEEIQDEAIFCRYCQHDLTEKSSVLPVFNSKPQTQRTKPLRSAFWLALPMGLLGGLGTWWARSLEVDIIPKFGNGGYLSNLILGTISSIILWGLVTSVLIWLWRVAIRQIPGVKSISKDSGCYSVMIYSGLLIGFFVLAFSTSGPEGAKVMATERTRLITEKVGQNKTAGASRSTRTPIAMSWQLQGRIEQLVSSGFIENTDGRFHKMQDFSDTYAAAGGFLAVRKNIAPKNFILRTETTWESASNQANLSASGCGFVFHEQQDGSFYVVYLGMDGTAQLLRMGSNGTEDRWTEFYNKTDVPKDSAEFLLAVHNGRIIFLVDGVTVIDVNDYTIPDGSLGLSVHSGTEEGYGIRCSMKNIELIELPD